MKTFVVLGFFLSDRAQRVFLRSSSPARRPPAPTNGSVKKVVSGDPVAARLLYATLTKMVTFSGWKRFEMNDTLKFHGVTEMTFPSIMRRSLIIDRMGRFAGAQRLASLQHPGALSHAGRHEIFRDLTACGGCPVHCRPRVSCATSALRPSDTRLKGTLRAVGTAVSPGRPCARLAGRMWPSTRTAAVTGSPLRPGAETVAARPFPGWLLGDEEGRVLCHVSLVKHCLERG